MFDDTKYSELKHDVTTFVKTKVKDVKFVEEIFSNRCFQLKELRDEDYEYSCDKLSRMKKILQITINAYNNSELYKDYTMKFMADETDQLHPMDSFYNYDNKARLWKFKKIPTEIWLAEALFNYVLCFLYVEGGNKRANSKSNGEKDYKCACCDEDMAVDDENCAVCESVNENFRRNNEMKAIDKLDNVGKKSELNGEDDNIMKWKKKEDDEVLYNNEGKEKADISKKWKCRECGLLNEYTFINCSACAGLCKEGTWSCGECTMVNMCDNNRCSVCEVRNIYLAEVPDNTGTVIDDNKYSDGNKIGCDTCVMMEDGGIEVCNECRSMKTRYEGRIGKDEWKCGKCELLQGYTDIVCRACSTDIYTAGLWICDKCTFINECANERCNACEEYNEYLRKYCDVCRRNKVPLSHSRCNDCVRVENSKRRGERWRCQYDRCREMNNGEDDYCHRCKLCRYNSHIRGDNCRVWSDGRWSDVWVCDKCQCPNNLTVFVCGRCGTTRYKKKCCLYCLSYTDGSTKYCEKHRFGKLSSVL